MSQVAFSSWGRQVIDNRQGGDVEVEVAKKKLPITFGGEKNIAAFMGWDGLILHDPNVDVVAMAAEYAKRVQEDYCCAKCSPGKKGTRVMQDTLARIVGGQGNEGDLDTLLNLADLLQNCKCTLCQTSAVPVADTVKHFRDDYLAYIRGEKRDKKAVDYKVKMTAPCQDKCPAHVDIPAYIEAIKDRRFDESLEIIRESMPLPAVCGRVCPHPCETACRRANVDKPINIPINNPVDNPVDAPINVPIDDSNTAPVLASIDNLSVDKLTTLAFTATDSDIHTQSDSREDVSTDISINEPVDNTDILINKTVNDIQYRIVLEETIQEEVARKEEYYADDTEILTEDKADETDQKDGSTIADSLEAIKMDSLNDVLNTDDTSKTLLGNLKKTNSTVAQQLLSLEPIQMNSLLIDSISTPVQSEIFHADLEKMYQDIDESFEEEKRKNEFADEAATGITLSLTAGFVSWLLRPGTLIASLFATMPTWRNFDLVSILSESESKEQTPDETQFKNTEELQAHVKDIRTLIFNDQSFTFRGSLRNHPQSKAVRNGCSKNHN